MHMTILLDFRFLNGHYMKIDIVILSKGYQKMNELGTQIRGKQTTLRMDKVLNIIYKVLNGLSQVPLVPYANE